MAEKANPQGPWGPYPANGGGGSGTVESVTGVAPGIVNNTDPANPVIEAQFGSDTTVDLPNAASTPVPALELIATLTDTAVGAEVSQWVIKLLKAGVQVASYIFGDNTLTIPGGGIIFPDNGTNAGFGVPSPQKLRVTVGDFIGDILDFDVNGIDFLSAAYGVTFGTGGPRYGAGGTNTANAIISGSAVGSVEIGAAGANPTAATAGFINLPTCAGTPTGVPANVSTGKVSMVYDTTAHKIWVFDGGVWKSTAALT